MGRERLVDPPKRETPMCPPINGRHMGLYMVKSYKSKRGGVMAASLQLCIMTGKCLCFYVCASLCQISPLVQMCVRNQTSDTRLCNF